MEDRNLYGRATGLDERGRFSAFGGAVDAALKELLVEKNDFFTLILSQAAMVSSISIDLMLAIIFLFLK